MPLFSLVSSFFHHVLAPVLLKARGRCQLNGLDYENWAPLLDKNKSKKELQKKCDFKPVKRGVKIPLIGIVSRLAHQKGFDLLVKGFDAFDGTPVLDIKPYDNWDAALNFRVPKWVQRIKK